MKMDRPESPCKMDHNSNEAKPEYASDFFPAGISKKYFNIINQVLDHKIGY
jgi:hypothetical protein